MRVILTSLPVYSHLVPLVIPLAKQLQQSGHEVVVATGADFETELDKHQVASLILPRAYSIEQIATDPELAKKLDVTAFSTMQNGINPRDPEIVGKIFQEIFFGKPALLFGEDLAEAAQRWQPDLIVRECTEFGSALAAERLDIPLAVLDISPISMADNELAATCLGKLRTEFGLEASATTASLNGLQRIAVVPKIWYQEENPIIRHYLPPAEPVNIPLDPAIANLTTDGPLVLATLGSAAPKMQDMSDNIFNTIIETLGDLPCTGIVAIGKDKNPEDWPGKIPDNVHLTSFVQQRKLLPSCDMFITHAGFSGVRESLLAGVPMVAIPLFAEQPINAQRLTELGIGLTIDPTELTRETLHTAVDQVLHNPTFRVKAKGLQRRMLGLPGFDQLAIDLEKLIH